MVQHPLGPVTAQICHINGWYAVTGGEQHGINITDDFGVLVLLTADQLCSSALFLRLDYYEV